MTRAAHLHAIHACGEQLCAAVLAGDLSAAVDHVRERGRLVDALRALGPADGLTPDERVAAAAVAAQGGAFFDAATTAAAALDRAREALAHERRAQSRYGAAAPGPARVALEG